jgi:nucleotide-binding universal stress UspA family protein
MTFSNILFPIDFSERSQAIAPHVRAMVARSFAVSGTEASLTLLHLIEMPGLTYGTPEAPVMFDYPFDEIKDSMEGRLKRFAETEFPDTPVKVMVDQGDPGSCIAELARVMHVDLIMLPTRGMGKFRAALLGSVAAKVLHDAGCAVWTAGHCEEIGTKHTELRSVICAIDTVPEGTRLIRSAAELAPGAEVRLVHTVPAAETGAERYFDLEFAAFLEEKARERIAAMQKEAGTNFEVCVKAGSIPAKVREEALSRNADLVLIGRGALPHFAGRLRSHAYSIVRDMPCPVLSI